MEKWEYTQLEVHYQHNNTINRLNMLGREGWELVGVGQCLYTSSGSRQLTADSMVYTFKRRRE